MNIRQDNRWEKCLEIIKDNVKPEQFEAWLKPVEFVSFENGVIELRVKSYFFAEQWENKFSNLLDLTFARVFGKFRVKYIVGVVNNVPDAEVSVEGTAKSHIISKYEQSVQQPGNPFHKIEYGDIDPQLNPK